MYDELVKRLRNEADFPYNDNRNLMREAADAIEELSAYVALYKDGGETAMKVAQEYKAWIEELTQRCEQFQHMPPPAWIPVTERLPEHPENNDYYLVTIQCEHYNGWDDYVTGFAEWTERGWDELSCYIGQIKVVAWMPLPKPYESPKEKNDV